MSSSAETEHPLPGINGDNKAGVPGAAPPGGWQIICPKCDTVHSTLKRLCPVCVGTLLTEKERRLRISLENSDRLREFIDHIRNELFQVWHEQAVNNGHSSPQGFIEKEWRRVMKEFGFGE